MFGAITEKIKRSTLASVKGSNTALYRNSVILSIPGLRKKSLERIIDHVLANIRLHDEHIGEKETYEYVDTISKVFQHRPNLEHLSEEYWLRLVRLCNDSLQQYLDVSESQFSELVILNESSQRSHETSRSATPASLSRSSTSKGNSKSNSKRKQPTESRSRYEAAREIAASLVSLFAGLLSVKHAPVPDIAQESTANLLDYLREPGSSSQQEATFSCINSILAVSLTENLELAESITKQIIPQIRRLWGTKHPLLKEEMLLAIVYGEYFFPQLQASEPDEFRTELERLFEILKYDYLHRIARGQLHFEDIILDASKQEDNCGPLANHAFSVRTGISRAEQSWALLKTVSVIYDLIYNGHSSSSMMPTYQEDDGPVKRRKLDNPLTVLIDLVKTSTIERERIGALHIIVFLASEAELDSSDLQSIIDCLVPLVSTPAYEVASWATFGIAW